MRIVSDTIGLATRGSGDMRDITGLVAERLESSGLTDGTVTLFVPGATAGLTTIEYESGLVEDFTGLMEKLVPSGIPYGHDLKWGDGNGFSHLRASLLGPSLVVPFSDGRLVLGTWQQVVFIDFDNRGRSRKIFLQFIGE